MFSAKYSDEPELDDQGDQSVIKPVSRDKLIMWRIILLTKGNISLSNLVGQGSKET